MTAERSDFGARLRAAREARGLSLKDVAAATKISVLVLDALERDDASRLPGGLFSRAFVRAYAKEVGLDPEQTVRDFAEKFSDGETEGEEEGGRSRASTRNLDTGHSGFRWLGLAITLLLVGVWIGVDRYYANRAQQPSPAPKAGPRQSAAAAPSKAPAAEARPATDGAAQPLAPAPAVPQPSPPAAQAESGTGSQMPSQGAAEGRGQPANTAQAAPGPASAPSSPSQPLQAAPPAQPPASPTATAPAADPSLPLQIVVSPTSPCWVSAKVDGNRIVGRTVQPGEKLPLSAAKSIVLTVGDAAALSYTVNGAPGRSLGTSGQVVTVVITTNNYRTFLAGGQ